MVNARPLTTTSFALLGLLSVRSWSAYELTGQMKRGLRHTWPRTETRIYQEPKNLVAHGLATGAREATGNRPRTVYTITGQGRAELRRWLAQPSAPPQLECEAVLRATFAESGSLDDLRDTVRGLGEHARTIRAQLADQAEDYLTTGGPFPHRLHLITLIGEFLIDYALMLEGWASWADNEITSWSATGPADAAPSPTPTLQHILHRARDRPKP